MTDRRKARRVAIDVLYQADITDTSATAVLAAWSDAGRAIPTGATRIVEGVVEHGPAIDLLLEEHAEGWTLARMSALDRTILRVGVEELRYRDDVPDAVAISEAVEAADELSSDSSRSFVNGILGAIAAAP